MSDSRTFVVNVEIQVNVTVDADKFDEAFMEEFMGFIGGEDTIEWHVQNLARLEATGLIDGPNDFIEGYGKLSELGVKTEVVDVYKDIVEEL